MKTAKITDSVSMKALIFLQEGRVVYPPNINGAMESITVDVYGEHSGSLIDPNSETPYCVTIRKDGSFACTCDNANFTKVSEYRQFWGDVPIRAKPECSHVLAAKLHPLYFLWISDGKREKKPTKIKCKIRTGKIKVAPTHSTQPNQSRSRRNVNLSDVIKKRKQIP
jgi:hypothetical protein